MNIQQAREKIREGIRRNATMLDLQPSPGDIEKLTSEDLEELMPEILEITALTNLDARHNKLSDLSLLKELKNLEVLVLGSNDISDISVLRELENLTDLFLWQNKIQDLSPIRELTGLKALGLRGNKIEDISALVGLKNLRYLTLSENQIRDISAITGLKNLELLFLKENPAMEKIPAEILEDGDNPARIIDYWLSLKKKGSHPLNEAKVVVVGQGSVGKTTPDRANH